MKTKADRHLLEKEVLGLRVWMIIGIVGLALTVLSKLLLNFIGINLYTCVIYLSLVRIFFLTCSCYPMLCIRLSHPTK